MENYIAIEIEITFTIFQQLILHAQHLQIAIMWLAFGYMLCFHLNNKYISCSAANNLCLQKINDIHIYV